MIQGQTDPLHGHCLCEKHALRYKPRREGIKFFFILPEHLPKGLVCGRCAPKESVTGGLMVSEESLLKGIVTFLKNAAYDIHSLKDKAVPFETYLKNREKS